MKGINGEFLTSKTLLPADIKGIEEIVVKHFGVNVSDLAIRTRKPKILDPRMICMYWRWENTSASGAEIGYRYRSARHPEGFDHSTVSNAVKTIGDRYDTCPETKKIVDNVKQELARSAFKLRDITKMTEALKRANSSFEMIRSILDRNKSKMNAVSAFYENTNAELSDKTAALANELGSLDITDEILTQ